MVHCRFWQKSAHFGRHILFGIQTTNILWSPGEGATPTDQGVEPQGGGAGDGPWEQGSQCGPGRRQDPPVREGCREEGHHQGVQARLK